MEADGVAESTSVWGDQNHSSPRAGRHYGPVEVHCPVLVGDVRGEAFLSLLGFLSPNEGIRLFEEVVEWHPPFAEPGDEAT